MLRSLDIRNFAIIEAVHLDLHKGLNIITGETGAGKSILMGALGLVLGKRADTSVLRNKQEKCTVEAVFDIEPYKLQDFFLENDLDYEDQTIIRREINSAGKSRAFINDQPVTLDVLQELTGQLVDIHAQHEVQQLLQPVFYLRILDSLAGQNAAVSAYRDLFSKLKAKEHELAVLRAELQRSQQEQEFLQYQYDELEAADLSDPGLATLEQEIELLENAEMIKTNIAQALQLLEENEISAANQVREAARLLAPFTGQDEVQQVKASLDEWIIELREHARTLAHVSDRAEYDPEKIQLLTDRQNVVNKLLQKHHCNDVGELLAVAENIGSKLLGIQHSSEALNNLEDEVKSIRLQCFEKAEKISGTRRAIIPNLEKKVDELLRDLGMPYASTSWKGPVQDISSMNINGIDDIDLYFSPNKGSVSQTLDKIGSGGERSRLMLAIKSVVAGSMALPTLIFDEIDTGVSGAIAGKIGDAFRRLSAHHQLVAITHLPQVAAKSDRHFFVYKLHDKAETYTEIKTLNDYERIEEIAKMLSGEMPGSAALQTAKELMS